MEHLRWLNLMDKSAWGDGPWQQEPDKEQWADESTGLACLLVRNATGALCGYVGVPPGHPWHNKICWEIPSSACVRDLSYSGACEEGPPGGTICHVAAPGEPDTLWWLGFHCSSAWDLTPGLFAAAELPPELVSRMTESQKYRTVNYVKTVCALLARAAKDAENGVPLAFTCPCCGVVSNSSADLEDGYCGNCHAYTGDQIFLSLHKIDDCPHRTDRCAS